MAILSGVTVLVAEDDPFMRTVVETALIQEKATLVSVADGQQALDYLCGKSVDGNPVRSVDVALLDFMMPKVHGLHVLKQIRCGNTMHLAGLPTAILTSAGDSRTVASAVRLDCSAFIIKPLHKPILLDRMARLVSYIGRQARGRVFYQDVDVGAPDGFDRAELVVDEPDSNMAAPPPPVAAGSRCIRLSEAEVGMIVTQDFIAYKDIVLIPKGMTVTKNLATILCDLDRLIPKLQICVAEGVSSLATT